MANIFLSYHERRFHLDPGDFAQRVVLCHWITPHPQLTSVILFTYEKSITRGGINNEGNLRTWPHGNPYKTSQQFPKEVVNDRTVWVAR